MSRSGVEEKIPWQRVPSAVRLQVEQTLGAPVARAARIWGGYSPTPTFRLALKDGRRAFFKATYAETNAFATQALYAEERVYRELGDLLAGWIPAHYATVEQEDWHGLLLEDVGPKSVPPWTPALARGITHALAAFHGVTLGVALPTWLERPDAGLVTRNLSDILGDPASLQRIDPDAAAWLQAVAPTIDDLMQRPILAAEPHALLHGDLRSDNLRFRRGKLTLFDWPAITVGRAEWDFVAFAQSVTVEGGVAPEQLMAWYAERMAVDEAVVDCAVAWWLAFFVVYAWRDELDGLPRLRRFQRHQVSVLAQWAARRFALPEPMWVAALVTT